MRLDSFIKRVKIVKRRHEAYDMCKSSVIFVNNLLSRPSKRVKVGDFIKIYFLDETKSYRVLNIPSNRSSISKQNQHLYIETVREDNS